MPDEPDFDPADDAQAGRKLENYANQLHELGFDSVRIFVTRRLPNGTSDSMNVGAGQWYAAYGAVCEWVQREEAKMAEAIRREAQEEDDDA